MLRKELSLSQYSSLQNNPLIQAIEFVFCAFAFYCRYFRTCIIHLQRCQGRAKLLLVTSPHKRPTIIWGLYLHCFVYRNFILCLCGLLLSQFNYSNKSLHVEYGSVQQYSSTLGTFEAHGASYPVGSWTIDQWTPWLGKKVPMNCFHEVRIGL